MVSHGLITGSLFLISGALYERGATYPMDTYSGRAGPAPELAAATAVAALASLGVPGFIAEFQIFTGSLTSQVTATAISVAGILITAAPFLRALRRMSLGSAPAADRAHGRLR